MFDTVDEVGRVCQAENIDAHYAKGGTLNVATIPFQVPYLKRHLEHLYRVGFSETDYRWLPEHESRARLAMTPNHGALHFAHCAAVHPARLVLGLADVVRRQGTRIYEGTPVNAIESGSIATQRGKVNADAIVRATEGYTDTIAGQRRRLMPIYSMVTATEPLPESLWQQIGLKERETFGDRRRLVIYGQRTLDNRLVLGGRAGYYFGSKRRRSIPADDPKVVRVKALVTKLFPMLEGYEITHGWGGLMGVPRHWRPCVQWDTEARTGWAGGYVGEGVAASNLAGRAMADLVTGRTTALTELPWMNDVAFPLGTGTAALLRRKGDRILRRPRRPRRIRIRQAVEVLGRAVQALRRLTPVSAQATRAVPRSTSVRSRHAVAHRRIQFAAARHFARGAVARQQILDSAAGGAQFDHRTDVPIDREPYVAARRRSFDLRAVGEIGIHVEVAGDRSASSLPSTARPSGPGHRPTQC